MTDDNNTKRATSDIDRPATVVEAPVPPKPGATGPFGAIFTARPDGTTEIYFPNPEANERFVSGVRKLFGRPEPH